ncbi:hypothetical protein [Dielma fastidiosa]|uniref:hypothetical protein n=1 Tax=Dielma fastidiosa TaxID=1034346 RepID=UPI0023F44FE3|nr:hypothetical protein [Dielma fastidiosa]
MNNFVESLKRLYKEQQITYAHVLSFYDKGKISKEAAEYILNAPLGDKPKVEQKGENITV